MKKLIYAGLGMVTLLLLGAMVLFHQPPVGSVQATVDNKHVEVNTPDISCGIQQISFTGSLTFDVGTSSDWLVVYLDGNEIYAKEVSDAENSFTTDPVEVGFGEHELEAILYNTVGEYNNIQAESKTTFNVKRCPEYKTVTVHTNCDETVDITIATNTHRGWSINDGETVWLGEQGGGVDDEHTWENISVPYTIKWYSDGKGWTTIDRDTRGYEFVDTQEVCEVPEQPSQPSSSSSTSPASAPQCPNGVPAKVPANPHVIRNGSQATVKAHIPEGDHVNIYFKVNDASGWQHSARDIAVNDKFVSYTINDLDPNLGYTFGIQSANGCAGGETVLAVIVDPPADGEIFMFSYWEWMK
jgi:hypothetical protein